MIEYKAENGRQISAVDAAVTEFFNPVGRGARTRAFTIARGIKPRSGGRQRRIQLLLNRKNQRKGTNLAMLRMPYRKKYRDTLKAKSNNPLTEDKETLT